MLSIFYKIFSQKITRSVVSLMLSAIFAIAGASETQAQRPSQRRRVAPSRSAPGRVSPPDVYTLGEGDIIRIDNADLPQQNNQYLIPTGGLLNLPFIGSVLVKGLTLEQAAQVITDRYNRVLKNPEISVRLIEPRPLRIAIAGELNRPGSYIIPVLDTRTPGVRYPTVSQAIQQAEGVTQMADIRRIQVRRRQASVSEQVISINLQEFIQTGARDRDITLRDGDTIFVPTATSVTLSQARQLATASIATDLTKPRTVTVVGEVSNPGAHVVIGGNTGIERTSAGLPTVTRAIQLAGGTTSSADIRRIQVRRLTKAGAQQIFNLDLERFLQAGDATQDLIVQEGDTIVIPTATNVTLPQARELATTSFAADLTKPRTVTVVGEVSRPGSYVVIGGTTGIERVTVGLPTLTRAIQLAGGTTSSADIRRIQVRRPTKSGPEQIFNLDLWQFLQMGDASQDLIVQEGDTIFIPTATDFNRAESRLLANANFATDLTKPRTVVVVGEVNRPGSYVVIGGTTGSDRIGGGLPNVSRAIQLAGGITPLADIRAIQIRRTTHTGTEQVIDVNYWQLLQAGDFNQDQIVQEGDTIFVPTAADVNPAEVPQISTASISPNNIRVSVAGEVTRPGRLELPPNTTLNQALLATGGFNRSRANRSTVELIRLNPNGTVLKRRVAVDFNQGINEQTNPLLRDNDIIVVGRSGLARFSDIFEATVGAGGIFTFVRILELLGILQ